MSLSVDNSETELTLPIAQQQFVGIMGKLASEDKLQIIKWIKLNWLNDAADTVVEDNKDEMLKMIASDIRNSLPPEAILPSETINDSMTSDSAHSKHIDSFLYDDEDIDALGDTGKLDRNFCLNCGSHKTKPLNFISHSFSREQLSYVFTALLPPLTANHSLLDVGSRLGAVLYGASLYTNAARIIGIEINPDLCSLQRNIIKKFGFQEDRIQVVEGNILHRADLLQASNVIVMNNVFECFMTPPQQVDMWKYLRQTIKSDTLLVTFPALDNVFGMDQTGIVLSDWVEELPLYSEEAASNCDASQMEELKAYRVL